VAHAVVLELLRGRALLVNVVALAAPEGPVHLPRGNVDGVDGGVVEATPVAGVPEHGERLPAVIDQHLLAPEPLPRVKPGS
jgi:hypothetical protein